MHGGGKDADDDGEILNTFEYCNGSCSSLPDTCGLVAVRLANVCLDVWSEDSQDHVHFRDEHEGSWCSGMDIDRVMRIRLAKGEDSDWIVTIQRKIEGDEFRSIFEGPACYWLKASSDQLESLSLLSSRSQLSRRRSIFSVSCSIVRRNGCENPVVQLSIGLLHRACHGKLQIALAAPFPRKDSFNRATLIVMEWLFPGVVSSELHSYSYNLNDPLGSSDLNMTSRLSPVNLLARLCPDPNLRMIENEHIPSELIVHLRPYQKRAVFWMLEREGVLGAHEEIEAAVQNMMLGFFHVIAGVDGISIGFCPFNCTFSLDTQKVTLAPLSKVFGGILADEMGLGKTVELLALILANKHPNPSFMESVVKLSNPLMFLSLSRNRSKQPLLEAKVCLCNQPFEILPGGWVQCCCCATWQHAICYDLLDFPTFYDRLGQSEVLDSTFFSTAIHKGKHVCTFCWYKLACEANGTCGSTLIVCPQSIRHQWVSEIARHTRDSSVSVIVYDGVRSICDELQRTTRELIRAYAKVCKQRSRGDQQPERLLQALDRHRLLSRKLLPKYLIEFDVVVTTYEVFRAEVHHVALKNRKRADQDFFSLRKEKRYHAPVSPLGCVSWHRVCLDEAQEVENSTAAAAELVSTLTSTYRWAITGTPIGRHGVEDMYGLLLFLRVNPFINRGWWRKGLIEPLKSGRESAFERFDRVFKPLFWRHTKADVKDELHLPPKLTHTHRLALTPVERHFYDKQYERVQNALFEMPTIHSSTGVNNAPSKLLGPFLRLRQICCHFQVGTLFGVNGVRRGENNRYSAHISDSSDSKPSERGRSATVPMNMHELHEYLVSNAKIECEGAQRLLVMNLNAVSGVQLAMNQPRLAMKVYLATLSLIAANAGKLNTDSLQRLHTLEGLKHILTSFPKFPLKELHSEIERNSSSNETGLKELFDDEIFLSDGADFSLGKLEEQISEIRLAYMLPYDCEYKAAYDQYQEKVRACDGNGSISIGSDCIPAPEKWWILALDAISSADDGIRREQMLADRIRLVNLCGVRQDSESLSWSFGDLNGLKLLLNLKLSEIDEACKDMREVVKLLAIKPTHAEIFEAADCQICRSYLQCKGPACTNCKRKLVLDRLQKLIYRENFDKKHSKNRRKRGLDEDDQESQNAGIKTLHLYHYREPCMARAILRTIKSAVKSVETRDYPAQSFIKAADQHFLMFEQIESQLSAALTLWRKRDAHIKACDELSQATLRMRMQLPGEKIEQNEEQWKIRPDEAYARLQGYELESVRTYAQLKQCLSQMRYLDTIKVESKEVENSTAHGNNNGKASTDAQQGRICPICRDEIVDKFAMLICGHGFCIECVSNIRGYSSQCPTCRLKFSASQVRYASLTDQTTEKKETADDLKCTDEDVAFGMKSKNINVRGSLGSKMTVILHELLKLEISDPSSKILVFSQWHEVLDILEHGLILNDILFVRLKAAAKYDQALQMFRQDPSVRAMLLPIKSGGKGLNLTEATHVFFVEPLCSLPMEAQAVGRVHRMGQFNPVHVHHFVVEDSIEMKIFEMFHGVSDCFSKEMENSLDECNTERLISEGEALVGDSIVREEIESASIETSDFLDNAESCRTETVSLSTIQSLLT